MYTCYMMTVDNLLLKIVNFSSPTIEEMIHSKDARVLRSLATSINSHVFITENQSRLLMKILRENQKKMSVFSEEIYTVLNDPSWSKSFRHIEQVKKLYIGKNEDHEAILILEFTYNSEIRKIMGNLSKIVENLVQVNSGKTWTAELTEKNIVALVDQLTPLNFDIDETIKNHYHTIKAWSKTEVEQQFFLTSMTNANFHKHITADLGIETSIDQNIINDRSVRYQYLVENPKNPGENLTEYLANRPITKLWVDKNQHTLSQLLSSLISLKRLPVLFVFDNVVNEKYYQNLELLSKSLEEVGVTTDIGIYFRLPNDDIGKRFNGIIAEKKYNSRLDSTLKVAAVMGGKIPKFFLTSTWRPMSVIALDTKMGLRHGKTSVYTNCCDLIVEYSDETSVLEERKLNIWR